MKTLDEAKAECERWFVYLQTQEDKSIALQKLTGERRTGRCNAVDGERRRQEIQGNGLTGYDGADLQDAVRILLKHCPK